MVFVFQNNKSSILSLCLCTSKCIKSNLNLVAISIVIPIRAVVLCPHKVKNIRSELHRMELDSLLSRHPLDCNLKNTALHLSTKVYLTDNPTLEERNHLILKTSDCHRTSFSWFSSFSLGAMHGIFLLVYLLSHESPTTSHF